MTHSMESQEGIYWCGRGAGGAPGAEKRKQIPRCADFARDDSFLCLEDGKRRTQDPPSQAEGGAPGVSSGYGDSDKTQGIRTRNSTAQYFWSTGRVPAGKEFVSQ
jgi:hypothetical protein